jgi:hypothetical protein
LTHAFVFRGLFLQEIGSHRLASRLISEYFPLTSTQLADYNDVQPSLVKMLEEAQLLSDELFHLQEVRLMNRHHPAPPLSTVIHFSQALLSTNEAIAPPPRKRHKTGDVRSVKDFTSEFREATQAAASVEHMYFRLFYRSLYSG